MTAPDQEVLITRIFDAPREQVFQVWTDPDEVAAWYGPEHMDVPREKVRIDPRVGGRWELTMVQRAGGMEFAIGYEIVEPALIVMRSDPMPAAGVHEPTSARRPPRARVLGGHASLTDLIVGRDRTGFRAAADSAARIAASPASMAARGSCTRGRAPIRHVLLLHACTGSPGVDPDVTAYLLAAGRP